jgi:carbamoylphosphate synthase large subunit
MALEAVKALDLDFGAVDIMTKNHKDFKEHVVVEVNTAPSYTPYLISKYGSYFNLLFKTEDKYKSWEFEKFKKAPSFAWKNYQLKGKKRDE